MQRKKLGPALILAAFVLIISLHWLWWLLLKGHADTTNYENRALAEFPAFSIENYAEYPGEFENYFNDHLSFRNELVTLNSAIDYFAFQRSSNTKVTPGKDGWLFYTYANDGDPLACYQGTNLFTQEELENMAANCEAMQAYMEEQGKEFVLFIAPNKERVYSEFLPNRLGKTAEEYRVLQLVRYLKEHTSVRVVYPLEELMEAKAKLKEQIYFKTDTHWNYVGAYIGTSALLRELNIDMPVIGSEEAVICDGEAMAGDLAGMLHLSGLLKNDINYTVTGFDTHDIETVTWGVNEVIQYKAKGADPRKLYVYRDSFASHMASFLGSQFNESYLRHRNTYSFEDFLEQDPDIFVFETVERYLGDLNNVFRVKES